jgi:hypothetical protein
LFSLIVFILSFNLNNFIYTILFIIYISLIIFYYWFKKFDIYIKQKSKKTIENKISKIIFNIKTQNERYKKLSEIILNSQSQKQFLEIELHNYSIYINYISLFLGLLGGVSIKSNNIKISLFLIFLFFMVVTIIYFLIEILSYSKTYQIEMYNYQILYAEFLLNLYQNI